MDSATVALVIWLASTYLIQWVHSMRCARKHMVAVQTELSNFSVLLCTFHDIVSNPDLMGTHTEKEAKVWLRIEDKGRNLEMQLNTLLEDVGLLDKTIMHAPWQHHMAKHRWYLRKLDAERLQARIDRVKAAMIAFLNLMVHEEAVQELEDVWKKMAYSSSRRSVIQRRTKPLRGTPRRNDRQM